MLKYKDFIKNLTMISENPLNGQPIDLSQDSDTLLAQLNETKRRELFTWLTQIACSLGGQNKETLLSYATSIAGKLREALEGREGLAKKKLAIEATKITWSKFLEILQPKEAVASTLLPSAPAQVVSSTRGQVLATSVSGSIVTVADEGEKLSPIDELAIEPGIEVIAVSGTETVEAVAEEVIPELISCLTLSDETTVDISVRVFDELMRKEGYAGWVPQRLEAGRAVIERALQLQLQRSLLAVVRSKLGPDNVLTVNFEIKELKLLAGENGNLRLHLSTQSARIDKTNVRKINPGVDSPILVGKLLPLHLHPQFEDLAKSIEELKELPDYFQPVKIGEKIVSDVEKNNLAETLAVDGKISPPILSCMQARISSFITWTKALSPEQTRFLREYERAEITFQTKKENETSTTLTYVDEKRNGEMAYPLDPKAPLSLSQNKLSMGIYAGYNDTQYQEEFEKICPKDAKHFTFFGDDRELSHPFTHRFLTELEDFAYCGAFLHHSTIDDKVDDLELYERVVFRPPDDYTFRIGKSDFIGHTLDESTAFVKSLQAEVEARKEIDEQRVRVEDILQQTEVNLRSKPNDENLIALQIVCGQALIAISKHNQGQVPKDDVISALKPVFISDLRKIEGVSGKNPKIMRESDGGMKIGSQIKPALQDFSPRQPINLKEVVPDHRSLEMEEALKREDITRREKEAKEKENEIKGEARKETSDGNDHSDHDDDKIKEAEEENRRERERIQKELADRRKTVEIFVPQASFGVHVYARNGQTELKSGKYTFDDVGSSEVREALTRANYVVMGDAHGSALKILEFAILSGFATMPPESARKFKETYKSTLEKLQANPQANISNELEVLENLIDQVEGIRDYREMRLIGDTISDRGLCDALTIKLMNKLRFVTLSYLSNHDLDPMFRMVDPNNQKLTTITRNDDRVSSTRGPKIDKTALKEYLSRQGLLGHEGLVLFSHAKLDLPYDFKCLMYVLQKRGYEIKDFDDLRIGTNILCEDLIEKVFDSDGQVDDDDLSALQLINDLVWQNNPRKFQAPATLPELSFDLSREIKLEVFGHDDIRRGPGTLNLNTSYRQAHTNNPMREFDNTNKGKDVPIFVIN